MFTEDTAKHTILSDPKNLAPNPSLCRFRDQYQRLPPLPNSLQSPKAIHVTTRSPRGSHINSPSPPHPLSSIHRYTIQLKFISTNVILLNTIHSWQESKGSPSNSKINPEELDGEYSSQNHLFYNFLTLFSVIAISSNWNSSIPKAFLLNTIHSPKSPKAVHLTPSSIQCYHPPPPLHHLLQPEFKINTSNCKRHSCPKGNQSITTANGLSNDPPPLVFIH